MLSLRLLRSFKVVAEELHFGRAAKILNMTQPPLSQQMKQLEDIVDVALFRRTTRQVELTEAGRTLLDHAVRLLADAERAVRAVQRAAERERSTFTLAYTTSAGGAAVPRLLAAFSNTYPEATLQVREMTAENMLQALENGSVEIALLRPPAWCFTDPRFVLQAVHSEPLVVALLPSHPLAALERIPVHGLDQQKFIAYSSEEAGFSHELCLRLFQQHHIEPDIVQSSRLPTILSLVEAGLGVALVPASAAKLWSGQMVYRPLAEEGEAVLSTIYAATLAENTPSRVAEVVHLLTEVYR